MGDWSNNLEYEQREYYGHFYDTDKDTHEEEENKREWIPVSERLPEDKQRVLVDYGEKIGFMIINFNAYGHYGFKAWQPLPEPYKEKGGE